MMKLWMLAPLVLAVFVQDPATAPLKLSIKATRAATVGGDIQVDVTLTNTGQQETEVVPLQLDDRSLSFSIKWTAPSGKTQSFKYSVLNGDPHIAGRLALQKVKLGAGASFSTAVVLPAVRVGSWSITATHGNLKSDPVTVQVAANDGKTELSALVTLDYEGEDHTFRIQLNPDGAPNSVCQFVSLAKRGFYNGLKVFAVVRKNWIRTGCPYNDGYGTPGYTFETEADAQPKLSPPLLHKRGTVALSQSQKVGYQGSQFFVCLRTLSYLDGKFTILGETDEDGVQVAKDASDYAQPERDSDKPTNDVVVKSVVIQTK